MVCVQVSRDTRCKRRRLPKAPRTLARRALSSIGAQCIDFTGPTPRINYGARQGEDHWRTLAPNKGALLSEAWPATLFHASARASNMSNLNPTPLLLSMHIVIYKSDVHLESVYWHASAFSRMDQF